VGTEHGPRASAKTHVSTERRRDKSGAGRSGKSSAKASDETGLESGRRTMSAPHQWAAGWLRGLARLMPVRRRVWAEAMAAEVEEIESDGTRGGGR
jgi:hypothetical protein